MGDVYHKTGRGGAGNFYSQKDVVDAVNKANAEDIEAQRNTVATVSKGEDTTTAEQPPPLPAPTSSSSAAGTSTSPAYIRSGRGGAGNFVSSSSSTSTSTPAQPPASSSSSSPPHQSPVAASPPLSSSSRPSVVYTGRGGAGNWAHADAARKAAEEQGHGEEEKRRAALDAGIAAEIDGSLPAPPRIHHLHAPGRGRRPEVGVEEGLAD